MNRMTKCFLLSCFLVFALAQTNIYAQTPAPERDFSYDLTKDGKGIVIYKYTGTNRNLVIPKTIEGYPVKTIGVGGDIFFVTLEFSDVNKSNTAFPSYLETVIIPEGVDLINLTAFGKLTSLRKVVLPSTVTNIGSMAFYQCTRLTEINIPTGIIKIDHSAFEGCGELYDLIIPDSITSINFGTDVFKGCNKLRIATRKRLEELEKAGKAAKAAEAAKKAEEERKSKPQAYVGSDGKTYVLGSDGKYRVVDEGPKWSPVNP